MRILDELATIQAEYEVNRVIDKRMERIEAKQKTGKEEEAGQEDAKAGLG